MVKTAYERGLEQGQEKGNREGTIRTLTEILEDRFQTPLSQTVQERLLGWSTEQLQTLTKKILRAQSLKELGLEE